MGGGYRAGFEKNSEKLRFCGNTGVQKIQYTSTDVAPAFFYFLDFMRYCRKTETVKVISNQKEYLQEQAEISKCQF